MADMTKFEPGAKEGTIRTPKCRLIYPSLFAPTNMKGSTQDVDESKLKYRLSILVPKGSDTKALEDRIEAIIADQSKGDQAKARRPFIKVADQNSLEKYADDYPLLLRSTSKYQPDVVGPSLQKIQEDEAYSGRWGRATLNPYWYPSIDGGKPGVALGLNNVQFLDHDNQIGGSRVTAEDDFEPVDDVDAGDPDGSDASEGGGSNLDFMG